MGNKKSRPTTVYQPVYRAPSRNYEREAQINNEHNERMKQLEYRRQQQAEAARERREKREHEHKERLEKLANERKQAQLRHQKEMEQMKQQQKQQAIDQLNSKINQLDNKINTCETEERNAVAQENDCQKDLNILRDEQGNFEKRRNEDINEWMRKNQYLKVKSDLQNAKDEISKAIEKTSLLESSVGKFLRLTQGLVNATTVNQINTTKLSSTIKVFGETIDRESQYKLTLESYLEDQNLQKLIPILKEAEFETMEDMICEDDDEYKETLDMVNESIEEQINTWDETSGEPKPKKLSLPQKRKFKRMCTRPETWKDKQDQQEELAKESLGEVAPVLGKFFKRTYNTMKITDEILSIAPNLNTKQLEAIEDMENYNIKQENERNKKMIENTKNETGNENTNIEKNIVDNGEETKEEIEDRETTNKNEDTKEEEEEEELDIENVIYDNVDLNKDSNNNKLELQKTFEKTNNKDIIRQTELLGQAAIVSIDVIKSMENEFEGSETLDRALNLATGIESSCMNIVKAQSQIRSSLVLANKIIELKPSNIRETSKPLWDAVDKGVVNVYKNVLEMTKVSSEFFSFFLKFNQSLNFFLSGNKKNTSLVVSLQHLKKDVRDFGKFSITFEKQVQTLGTEAMKIIEDCIRKTAGHEAFEKALQERQIKQVEFDKLTKILIEKQLDWDKKRDKLYKKIFQKEAELKNYQFLKKQVQENLTLYRSNKQRCQEIIVEIRKR